MLQSALRPEALSFPPVGDSISGIPPYEKSPRIYERHSSFLFFFISTFMEWIYSTHPVNPSAFMKPIQISIYKIFQAMVLDL